MEFAARSTIIAGVDAGRTSVIEWSGKIAAAISVAAKHFFSARAADLDMLQPGQAGYDVLSWQSDATTSGVCQDRKVQALEIQASYCMLEDVSELCASPLNSYLSEYTGTADLQFVVDGSGLGCYATTLKQIESVGCPMFGSSARHPVLVGNAMRVRAWCAATDAGPDVKITRRIGKRMAFNAKEFWFDSDCFKHQLQIATGIGLKIVGIAIRCCGLNLGVKYFPGVARMMHCRRRIGKTHDFNNVCSALFHQVFQTRIVFQPFLSPSVARL